MKKALFGMMVVAMAAFVAFAADYTPVSKETTGGAVGAGQVTLASGKVIVGQSTGVGAAVTPSGDATVSTGGVFTIASRAVTGGKLPIMTAGQLLCGQADSNALAKTVSGDATIDADGVVAIGTGVIVNADVKSDAAISRSKLSLGGLTGSFQFLKIDGTTGTVYTADGVITNTP
jgi:hypothetical protein